MTQPGLESRFLLSEVPAFFLASHCVCNSRMVAWENVRVRIVLGISLMWPLGLWDLFCSFCSKLPSILQPWKARLLWIIPSGGLGSRVAAISRQKLSWAFLWTRDNRLDLAKLLMLTSYQNPQRLWPCSSSDPLLFGWVVGGTVCSSASLCLEGKWAQLNRQTPARLLCNAIINLMEQGKNITSQLCAQFSSVMMFRTEGYTGGCLCCWVKRLVSLQPGCLPFSLPPTSPRAPRTLLWIP